MTRIINVPVEHIQRYRDAGYVELPTSYAPPVAAPMPSPSGPGAGTRIAQAAILLSLLGILALTTYFGLVRPLVTPRTAEVQPRVYTPPIAVPTITVETRHAQAAPLPKPVTVAPAPWPAPQLRVRQPQPPCPSPALGPQDAIDDMANAVICPFALAVEWLFGD